MANQLLARIGPFGGLDASTDPLFVEPMNAIDMANFVPNRRYGSLILTKGRTRNVTGAFPYQIRSAFIYLSGLVPWIIAYCSDGGSNANYYIAQVGTAAAPTLVNGGGVTIGTSRPQYLTYGGNVYTGYSVDGSTGGQNVLPKTASTARAWGYLPNMPAPTVAVGAAGTLNGIYWYRTTGWNNNTQEESSPSPFSAQLNLANQQGSLSNLATNVPANSTHLNIYRMGGTLATWQQVGQIVAGTATFSDNTPDNTLIGASLVLHRDPPPSPAAAMCVHKDRIWLLGQLSAYNWVMGPNNALVSIPAQPADLWYSRYAEPWAFDSVNQVLPLGRDQSDDVGVGLASIGSVLLAFKKYTTWIVYGDTQADFRQVKAFEVGCANQWTIGTGYGAAFWLSASGDVWMYDGASLQNISEGDEQKGGIRTILEAANGNFSSWSGFVYKRVYYLTDGNVTYGYYMRTGKWFRLGFGSLNLSARSDLPMVVAISASSNVNVDQWFNTDGDGYGALTGNWVSPEIDSQVPESRKQYRYAIVEIPPSDPANTVKVTFYVDGVQVLQSTFNPRAAGAISGNQYSTGNSYYRVSLPNTARGYRLVVQVQATEATTTPPVVQRVSVYGDVVDTFAPVSVNPNGST